MSKRKVYQRIARLYDLLDLPFEHGRYKPIRGTLFKGTSGRILDAGVGTGRNMPFYPAASQVTGIDLSPAMLARAAWRKGKLGAEVELLEMDVRKTSFADGTFDTIISTFLFCVLEPEDQLPALLELKRIAKPGAEIRILEYDTPKAPFKRFMMRLWAPWVRFMYGAAFDRETEQYLPKAGLDLVEKRYLYQDIVKLLIVRPA
ncbi:MAG TPA: class I SAM-dependent methyltransferase [Rhodospirillales bacterium]|nr:class I SAM-dependent methyltransferase [Rhodospirillales bacterium]